MEESKSVDAVDPHVADPGKLSPREKELLAENERLSSLLRSALTALRAHQEAVSCVVDRFKADEAQGYRSRDRQYAIAILEKFALPSPPLAAPARDDIDQVLDNMMGKEFNAPAPERKTP